MSRLFVVGDVHGMLPELESLVGRLQPREGDRFAFLGDLVDKGPQSMEVIAYVRRLLRLHPGSLVVCGNHEEAALRAWELHQKHGTWDKVARVEREPWLPQLDQETVDWLRTLPLFARPRPGVLLVHGGLFPAFFDNHTLPPASPEDWHRGGGKVMDRMRRFLRVRHVYRHSGQMVQLGEEGPATQRWADWYDGREGFAFYGHDPSPTGEPIRSKHAMGLDTGAVTGGNLTAAILADNEQPGHSSFRTVSVPGRALTDWYSSQGD